MSNMDSAELTGISVSKSLLIISNISKRANVRSLLQVGVAFGCSKILIVGQKSFNFTFTSDNDDDTVSTDIPKHLLPVFASGDVTIVRFDKWQNCVSYLKENSIILVGVEIHTDAKTIHEICNHVTARSVDDNLSYDVAFLMGNEGTGLQEKQMNTCDMFCRIPQYGCGTASLNVYVAASIVLYNFHQYQRRQRQASA